MYMRLVSAYEAGEWTWDRAFTSCFVSGHGPYEFALARIPHLGGARK